MKNKNLNLNLKDLPAQLSTILAKVGAYKAFIFFLIVAGVYGYIVLRINTLSNIAPNQSEVTAQRTAQPRINPSTIAKIQSLQDNSVSVQTIFQQARDNPFNE